jgi:hypothetical protein
MSAATSRMISFWYGVNRMRSEPGIAIADVCWWRTATG